LEIEEPYDDSKRTSHEHLTAPYFGSQISHLSPTFSVESHLSSWLGAWLERCLTTLMMIGAIAGGIASCGKGITVSVRILVLAQVLLLLV
jgi:hypothetical protein